MINEKLLAQMREMGWNASNPKPDYISMSGRLDAALTFMRKAKGLAYAHGDHVERAPSYMTRSDTDSFNGGTARNLRDDLEGRVDLRPFIQAREKFAQSSLAGKLQEKYQNCQPRRQRVMSEYDGEFDESRRWSLAPFQGVRKAQGPGRAIEIIADMSVNCSASAKDTNAYGCLVWALTEIIESLGINVKLVFRYGSEAVWVGGDGEILIICKEAGEYTAPSLLATACKANFFRRTVFSLYATLADISGHTSGTTLGRSRNSGAPIEFKDGSVRLQPNARTASFEEIEKVLLQATT